MSDICEAMQLLTTNGHVYHEVSPDSPSSADASSERTPSGQPEEAPDLKPSQIRVGNIDQAGRDIVDVYWTTRDYTVYRWRKCTAEKTFFWFNEKKNPSYGITAHFGSDAKLRERLAVIGPNLAHVCGLQKGSLSARGAINCEIARGISLALEDHVQESKEMLSSLETRLQCIRNTEDRSYYALFLTILVIAVVLGMLFVQSKLSFENSSAEGAKILASIPLVVIFGALGGYFSVLTKINKLAMDPEASRVIIIISAAMRLFCSVTGAVAVYMFILSTFGKIVANPEMMTEFATACTFAFLAGFSENFVPGIFRALEQRSSGQASGTNDVLEAQPSRVRRVREI